MPKVIQIASNNARLFVLADDGRIFSYDLVAQSWSQVPIPNQASTRDQIRESVVSTTRIPKDYNLFVDIDTGLWHWRNGAVLSEAFETSDEAISDARQRILLT